MSDCSFLSDISEKIGSIIHFNYCGESYRGTLSYADMSNYRLSILNIFHNQTNEPYLGFMEIYKIDFQKNNFHIESIEGKKKKASLLELDEKAEKDLLDEQILDTSNISILKHSLGFNNITPSSVISSYSQSSIRGDVESSSLSRSLIAATPFVIIVDIDSALSVLDSLIKKTDQIGFRIFINNEKSPSLVCMNVNNFIWCFDFLTIKKQSNDDFRALKERIKILLISEEITKIFHDHKPVQEVFSVHPRNFFDIDDCFKQLYTEQYGKNAKCDSDLRKLIQAYTNDFISPKRYDNLNWSERPLNLQHKSIFTKETKHLNDLYQIYIDLNKSIKSLSLLEDIFSKVKINVEKDQKKKENVIGNIPEDKNNNSIIQKPIQIKNQAPKFAELMEKSRKESTEEKSKKEKPSELTKDSCYFNYNFRPAGSTLSNCPPKRLK
ncbi:unnamed protein product [Brachionus calyciflorus]|uniref:3'-5' exonuclease domain-containing protein n=1 Tax=Brachionus calyciflorus TaxID=104777 RepID=A0A813S6Q6_9BILA|nr:unnamed protein product [Brachionus calyciflorus]